MGVLTATNEGLKDTIVMGGLDFASSLLLLDVDKLSGGTPQCTTQLGFLGRFMLKLYVARIFHAQPPVEFRQNGRGAVTLCL